MHRPTPSGGVPNLRHAAGQEGQQASASSQIAESLRQTPVQLPEMHRARLERNLVEAWRARGAHAVPLPRARLGLSRAVWMGSIAASAALGVALGFAVLRHPEAPAQGSQAGSVAHFDLVIGDGAVQSGTLVAGQVLESGKHGHIEVSLAQSRVDIAPDSRVRFEKLDNDELRLSLVQGRVDVAFHPEHKGEQRLLVETSAARVVVVGTQFAVETTANRETHVSVSEGVVRVEPRRGGQALLVHAGEQTIVGAERDQQLTQLSKAPHAVHALMDASQLAAPRPLPAARGVSEKARAGRARGRKAKLEERAASEYDAKLESARQLLLQGKHAAAREKLQRMTEGSVPPSTRVEALVLTAESYTAQGQVPRAAAAYRQAVEAAPREPAGHNALFALARLLDRYTEDNESAASAYREYLAKAPHGALARQARDALCRLTPCQ